MQPYFKILKSELENDRFSFTEFISKLNNEDLSDFLEDILTENYNNIQLIFPPSKGVYSDEAAFQALRELPYATFQKIQFILEDIFSSAIRNKYNNNNKVIDDIIALTARRKQGLSVIYIKDLLSKDFVSNEIKTNLGILLSKVENTVPLSYWDTDIDYVKQPYLIPAFISAYKNSNPKKALEKLITIPQKPSDFNYYRKSVISSLENILLKERNIVSYISINSRMPKWVQEEFSAIIESQTFSRYRIKEEVASIKEEKKEVRIGISLFPDLLLLYYAYKEGYFSNDKNFFYSVKIEDWNNIFTKLMDEEIDFIIANREICTEENGISDIYSFILPLIEYKGFSMIFQKDYPIHEFKFVKQTYLEEDKKIFDRPTAIKSALSQLRKEKKIKIFASKHTDHYKNLIDILGLVGMDSSDIIIISDKEPHEGYELFFNKEVDAIVGGLPQKLLALKNGGKELISQTECDLPLTQINGLICKTDRLGELEKAKNRIIHEWGRIVKEIETNPEILTNIATLYNQTLKDCEPYYHPIDELMFKKYWKKTYFIPTNKKEIESLSNADKNKNEMNTLKNQISLLVE